MTSGFDRSSRINPAEGVQTAYTIPLQLPTVRWSSTGLRAQGAFDQR
jgi:hypothetical protein